MGYRTLRQCVDDLSAHGHLVRLEDEVDACLEAAEIQRRVYRSGGPAVYFANVRGCRFPMVSNLFGTLDRARFMFRDTLDDVRKLIELKVDPNRAWRQLTRYWKAPFTALNMLPAKCRSGPVVKHETTVSQLPQLKSWPRDGGAFVTLPQVYTEHIDQPGLMKSNLGMYRIQLSGNRYRPDQEIGLHYQLHRGIGVHHTAAAAKGQPLRVNIFVGGTPSMTFSAVMPLPEGLSELTFAGALAGHRIPMICRDDQLPIYGEADFCISGLVHPGELSPEGPFGDHLGYYSLTHDFPVLRVDKVWHREGAIWPFTVVGRPPQEDTVFGGLIHELTGEIIPTVLPGVHGVHAVDESGVHPLLLAIGSERYTPYSDAARPQELLTQANAILGQGQMSLAKYLFIVNQSDDPTLDLHDIRAFFEHVLRRVDWRRDLHFQTCTTIDTLDYSGSGLNTGSKLVVAAAGPAVRSLATELSSPLTDSSRWPDGFRKPRVCFPGVLAVEGPPARHDDGFGSAEERNPNEQSERLEQNEESERSEHNEKSEHDILRFCDAWRGDRALDGFPWIVIVDDSDFTARNLSNFLWVVFTRSNPASDVYGVDAFTRHKHWGCRGPLVVDARIKPHHAPPLIEDPEITRKVDALAARGGPLARWL